MYLTDHLEKTSQFKVTMYLDHFPDPKQVQYFQSYESAYKYYTQHISQETDAFYTNTILLSNVRTGKPMHRQTWRVMR